MGTLKTSMVMSSLAVLLAACGTANETTTDSKQSAAKTVEITDAHGTVKVPVQPKKVVALDNRTFETLAAWDVELVAAPVGLLPAESPYAKDKEIVDVGMHFEPNLEAIAGVNPDVVIVGQRFADYYDEIKKLVPEAAVIDFDIELPETSGTPGELLVKGLEDTTHTLGQIFAKEKEADQLVTTFEQSIQDVKKSYNGKDSVMSVIVSGGDIGFSAPMSGRVFGPMYDIFGWKPALEVKQKSGKDQGDEVSVEAIAQSNPDRLLVLDRDAPLGNAKDAVPAEDVIDRAPALQKTTAVKEERIVYTPKDMYLNESIQTYSEFFQSVSKAFVK